MIKNTILCLSLALLSVFASATIVPVGSGSYTTHFPGVDAANRNSYPAGSPQLSGKALGKPVPTNDWWSALIKENHASNLFSYPITMKTVNNGLVVSYVPFGVIDDLLPVTVGVTGLSSSKATVSDYSDWTVTMNWNDNTHWFEATAGIAMPFLYFTKQNSDVASVTVTSGTVIVQNEMLILEKAKNGASFAVYAPAGSTWMGNNGTYTSTLNGKNYWSMAILPQDAKDVKTVANEYKKYAYVFPADTKATWDYNEKTSIVKTDFEVTTEVKEGTNTHMLIGLLPHQWAHLSAGSPSPTGYSYTSVRGEIKTMDGNRFTVENTFHGILPTLPYVEKESILFSAAELNALIGGIQNDEIGDWTDSYNDGQLLNRLIQTGRIAAEIGNQEAFNTIFATVKNRIENWLKFDEGEVAFLFYYNNTWSALLGYPSGHGQDNNLNDHHFHWGYFIHAAAFVEQYQPGWAAQWGDMVNMLVRDAAGTDRNDTMFPYLRNFSPYAGHCWANGFATFPQGNDQESTSESMQFNSSLIHWGTITGNTAIRDLGIYLYTTEQTAIEEYWFDMYDRIFPQTQQYSLVSRVWGNSFDNGTFWTNDIAASYGIELYPIHGGSLYLGHNIEYVEKLWNEITKNTGILSNQANDNLWHDIMWQYQSFIDPEGAIKLYNSYPNRSLKFGVSGAQTYHWIQAMAMLGQVDASLTADYPVAVAFNKNGRMTYVAHNYSVVPITVTFSDGFQLSVPARKMATASAGSMLPVVMITSPTNNSKVMVGEPVKIEADATDYMGSIARVEFYANGLLLGNTDTAPYTFDWSPASGTYALTAKAVNTAGKENTSKVVNVKASEDNACSITSTEASQGSFNAGYRVEYEMVGDQVVFSFELYDTRSDLIAYFWDYTSGFRETQMSTVGNNKFSYTLSGVVAGSTVKFACKFAFAGGMSVTKQIEYIAGTPCGATSTPQLQLGKEVQLFPNPVKSILNLQLTDDINQISLWNGNGSLMTNRTIPAFFALDMSGYPVGMYYIRIENSKGFYVGKVMKK